MTYTSEDSFKVTENEDGTFAVEWDPNDPRYSVFNTMTEEEMSDFFSKAVEECLKEYTEAENNEE